VSGVDLRTVVENHEVVVGHEVTVGDSMSLNNYKFRPSRQHPTGMPTFRGVTLSSA
jgi:hypothetical protein